MKIVRDEIRQLRDYRNYWDIRLAEIPREMETEPARIRATYEVRATRIEPLGLVYLWPVTG